MCLYTKFPAAIPLKRVDNESVLDAMFEIFSTFGLPEELLTDQGSVFTSKLTKAMCDAFGIHKLQTSPYHPQSDGALERWHACLKGMIKRSQCDIKTWDKQLKYRISSNSFRGIYSFQVLPAAATKRGRLLNEGGYF